MTKEKMSLILKTIIILVTFFGVLYGTGMFEGVYHGDMWMMYTNLSNILVMIYYIVFFVFLFKKKDSPLFRRMKGGVILLIIITGLVYDFVLADYSKSAWYKPSSICLHYLSPYLVLIDWLIFDRNNNFKFKDLPYYIILPLCYVAFALIRGAIVKNATLKYPYFFLNVDNLGYGGVFLWLLGLIVVFVAFAALIIFIDKKLCKKEVA